MMKVDVRFEEFLVSIGPDSRGLRGQELKRQLTEKEAEGKNPLTVQTTIQTARRRLPNNRIMHKTHLLLGEG